MSSASSSAARSARVASTGTIGSTLRTSTSASSWSYGLSMSITSSAWLPATRHPYPGRALTARRRAATGTPGPMPRSIWNGTIAFGLVSVPVKVYSATESKTVHFTEVHANDGAPIEHRRICPNDGEQVDYDDIVKGFEVKQGEWVELTDDEIAAAAGSQ